MAQNPEKAIILHTFGGPGKVEQRVAGGASELLFFLLCHGSGMGPRVQDLGIQEFRPVGVFFGGLGV